VTTDPPSPRLDHCVLKVSDWERSDAFYSDVVGATVVDLPFGRRAYRFDGVQLNVHGPDSAPHPLPAQPPGPGSGDLCFAWDGPISEAAAHLGRCGVEIIEGPVERVGARGNGVSVYFRDPDGTLLEFISYV
jgi:catechol 2,3-dioxygenase-like lactoylglutathione lyase family enzyme